MVLVVLVLEVLALALVLVLTDAGVVSEGMVVVVVAVVGGMVLVQG